MNPPVFVALDLDDLDQALQLAQKVSPYVGGYKIGPRLTYKYGALGVEKLTKLGSVLLIINILIFPIRWFLPYVLPLIRGILHNDSCCIGFGRIKRCWLS